MSPGTSYNRQQATNGTLHGESENAPPEVPEENVFKLIAQRWPQWDWKRRLKFIFKGGPWLVLMCSIPFIAVAAVVAACGLAVRLFTFCAGIS